MTTTRRRRRPADPARGRRPAPDVVVLDLGLPDLDGTEVIAGLRGWTPVPIMVLSARVGSGDKVHALDAGADDHVTEPIGMAELLARLRASVRRAAVATVDGEPVVDAGGGSASTWPRRRSSATAPRLVRHRGTLVGQRELLRAVWGPGYGTESHYLRVYRAQLRRKPEADPSRPEHFITEASMGYRFEV